MLSRIGVGSLLALSSLATATSLLGYALAPSWWVMVALGCLSGLGAGAIDAGLNTYVAIHHSPRTLNWLHACFGVGVAPIDLLLRACLIAVVVGAALVWLDVAAVLSFLGLALAGLALAPIFPSLIATTPARLGEAHTANAVGFQVAAAVLGGAVVPAAIGMLAGMMGLEVVGPSLLITACLLLVLHEALASRSRATDATRSAMPDDPNHW